MSTTTSPPTSTPAPRHTCSTRRTAMLSLRDNGDGTVEGRFRLPTLQAALLKKALETLTSPRPRGRRP